jgi:GT2 family glycosyltransferase
MQPSKTSQKMKPGMIRPVASGLSVETALQPVSLLICSRNRPAMLQQTIESVLQGDEVPTELLVIDQSNSPNPNIADLARQRSTDIRYIWTQTVGLSRARTAAIAKAQHAIVAILDDDMLVTSNWFGTLIRTLISAGDLAVVTGRVLPAEAEVPGGFVPTYMPSDIPAVYEGRIDTDVLAGGHMAAYRSIFNGVGGFDERLGPGTHFPAAEDNDLGYRILEAGYRIVYTPEAVVYHRAWRGKGEYMRMRWSYGRGKGGFYTKYFNMKDRHIFKRMIWDIAQRFFYFPHRLLRDPRRACGDVVYVAGILYGAAQWVLTESIKDETLESATKH